MMKQVEAFELPIEQDLLNQLLREIKDELVQILYFQKKTGEVTAVVEYQEDE